MTSDKEKGSRRISVEVPNQLIDQFDLLRKEWGLRSRGDVLERLLEQLLPNQDNQQKDSNIESKGEKEEFLKQELIDYNEEPNDYIENAALVLIKSENSTLKPTDIPFKKTSESGINSKKFDRLSNPGSINLPGFVQKKARKLKDNLRPNAEKSKNYETYIQNAHPRDIQNGLSSAKDHWLNLYGQKPNEDVIEAAMIWLARDIWPNIEGSDNSPFTWTAANRLMSNYCQEWVNKSPELERVIIIAGVLEDPFAVNELHIRVPTLIRRFVNSFKRSSNVTSFQTLESTMTVHGALKLLDLPTTAGSPLTLSAIREAYKIKALSVHPDAGGSTDAMRRTNEAYQLLKELYRQKDD